LAELASLLPIIGIFLIFWLLIIRPAQRRQKHVRQLQAQLTVGDRVLTTSGIFGTVASLTDDQVGLEVAEGITLTVARQAIGQVTEEVAGDPTPGTPDEERE